MGFPEVQKVIESLTGEGSKFGGLMEAQSKISYAFNASRVGTVTRVLADSYSDGVLVCRSEFESPEVDGEILVRGPEKLVGTFFDVKITGADEYDLVAELV